MSEARRFPRGCVASPHYLASTAGLGVLAGGGNAMDAALAANLVLGVVAPYMCGYGGDLFAIVYDGHDVHAYNGSGRAPVAATPDAVRDASVKVASSRLDSDRTASMPGLGPLSVTVPGAVEGWFTLLERFGTMDFAALASTALAYARDGFPLTARGARYMTAAAPAYDAPWGEAWRTTYSGARPLRRFRQPELARTIQMLCDRGAEAYYRGPIGEAIASTLDSHGGLMSVDDLAAHQGDWVEPLQTSYRGVRVLELPPNSQGVVALEALNILEGLDGGEAESAQRHHALIEATKLALADREAYITDPDHMRVEATELASASWAEARRASFDPSRAHAPEPARGAAGGTVYLCAADADGMLVSLIQSNFQGFGSGVAVPGWGINLQNRGAYFSLDDDHANVIAPRKRTMHTLMPALAFRESTPWLVFGTMGGDGQAQTHLQLLTRIVDDGADIQEAIDAPRWLVSPDDWSVAVESRLGAGVTGRLRDLGHVVTEAGPFETRMGHAHAIEVGPDGYAAASDPRSEGAALGL